MKTHNNRPEITTPTEQAVNELICYLSAMIDELQFKYCNDIRTTPTEEKDAEEEYDGMRWHNRLVQPS